MAHPRHQALLKNLPNVVKMSGALVLEDDEETTISDFPELMRAYDYSYYAHHHGAIVLWTADIPEEDALEYLAYYMSKSPEYTDEPLPFNIWNEERRKP